MTSTGPEVPLVAVREAAPAERSVIEQLITEAGLPVDGLADAAIVLVAEVGGAVVGTIALERHGTGTQTTFLLRSAAVDPAWRGRGLGTVLSTAALAHVDAAGAPVALLTETAGGWFLRFGFIPVDRTSLPRVLEGSEQLRGACPLSAQAMLRTAASS